MPVSISGDGVVTGLASLDSPTTVNGLTIPTTGFGKVLQVVRATDSTYRTTTSTSLVDITGMSVTITPKATTSNILVISSFQGQLSSASVNLSGRFVLTDSSNNIIGGINNDQYGLFGSSNSGTQFFSTFVTILGWVSPNTLSPVTYKLRASAYSGTEVSLRNEHQTGQMFAIEVAA